MSAEQTAKSEGSKQQMEKIGRPIQPKIDNIKDASKPSLPVKEPEKPPPTPDKEMKDKNAKDHLPDEKLKTPENADEEGDVETDASSVIDVQDDLIDDERKIATALPIFQHQMAQTPLWDSFGDGLIMKFVFFNSLDNIGAFVLLYMRYGNQIAYPFIVLTFLLAIPAATMEMWLGQFTSLDPVSIYGRMVPGFAGLGVTVICLNLAMLCAMIQRAVVYLSIATESLTPGDEHNMYQTCDNAYNNAFCRAEWMTCPADMPVWIENSCISNTTYKWNWIHGQYVDFSGHLPFTWPLYQFMFRATLGETDNNYVAPQQSAGINYYFFIWMALLFCVSTAGRYRLTKWVAVVTFFIFCAVFSTSSIAHHLGDGIQTYNFSSVIRTDTGNEPDKAFKEARPIQLWTSVAIYMLTSLGIGDGALIAFGSNHRFKSLTLLNAAVTIFIAFCFFIVCRDSVFNGVVKEILSMVSRGFGYRPGKKMFVKGFDSFLNNLPRQNAFFVVFLGTQQYTTYFNDMLRLFSIAGFFLVMTNALLRLNITINALTDKILGLPRLSQDNRFRFVIFTSYLLLLSLYHKHGLNAESVFYEFSMPLLSGFVVIMEVIICIIYGPKKVFANMCAQQLTWKHVETSRYWTTAVELLHICTIASWFMLPLFLAPAWIYLFYTPLNIPDTGTFSVNMFAKTITCVLFSPTFIYLGYRCFETWHHGSRWRNVFSPVNDVWGPKNRHERDLACNAEKEYQLRS